MTEREIIVTVEMTRLEIIKAVEENKDYGDGSFLKPGKFGIGDKVTFRDPRFRFTGKGVVVRSYVTLNMGSYITYRNPAYRVLCEDRKVRSTFAWYLKFL